MTRRAKYSYCHGCGVRFPELQVKQFCIDTYDACKVKKNRRKKLIDKQGAPWQQHTAPPPDIINQLNDLLIEGFRALLDRQDATIDRLDSLITLFKSGGGININVSNTNSVAGNLTRHKTSAAPSSLDADDLMGDLEITQAKSDKKPTFEMVINAYLIGNMTIEELKQKPDVVEYGVERGRLAEDLFAHVINQQKGQPKEMDVPKFDAPDFGDLDF